MRSFIGLFLFIVFFISNSNQAEAQIEAPDFLCVNNDTLVWNVPTVTCGPFNGYLVYGSQDIDGPYQLITTIATESQTQHFHMEAAGELWYYYLQSDYDCPGQTPLLSDTLDNRIPEVGPLVSVSVDGSDVDITWDPSPSPEVYGYIISRNTVAGTTIIDTVFNGTTFTDTNADPTVKSETYFVVALDQCGNKSLVDDPHQTLFLSIDNVSECDQSITMSWNLYQNWRNGIGSHVIWVGLNGAPLAPTDTIVGTASSYTFENANDMDTYCFVIEAVEEGTMVGAKSNEVCEMLDIVQPIRELVLENATITPDNTIDLNWFWNDNAELNTASILRAIDGSNTTTVQSAPPALPLSINNSFTDATIDPSAGPFSYTIETLDQCNDVFSSNTVTTVFLEGLVGANQSNQLNWTSYINEYAESIQYELYRVLPNGQNLLAEYDADTREHIDPIDISNPAETTSCYFVVAIVSLQLPDGTIKEVRSRSNTVCLEQRAKLFVPNAFVPDGVNTIFKPLLQFGTPESYSMLIYDRYGAVLFESTSLDTGWDGTANGKALPQGVYIYQIKLVQAGGVTIDEGGTVLLLR